MHAETMRAGDWWARPRGGEGSDWIRNYQKSVGSRQRTALVEVVRSLGAVTSVLEVGSHCGPNLVRLAQELPGLEQLTGIDVNLEAVTAGTAWVQRLRLAERIAFIEGRIPRQTQDALPDRCVDVVISCYAIAYIAPSDLDAVLWEMGRLARCAIVLAEPMAPWATSRGGVGDYREWAHDYVTASKWLSTWQGCRLGWAEITPPVDALSRVLIASRT